MGLREGMLGGIVGGEMVAVVSSLIEKHGGLLGVVTQMEQQGLGATVKSWIGDGQNLPISTNQIHQAFGSETINALAAKVGLNPQEFGGRSYPRRCPRPSTSSRPGAVYRRIEPVY